MSRVAIDLSGQRVGQLTVLRNIGRRGKAYYWHCRCACGTELDVRACNLSGAYTISCGCSRRGPRLITKDQCQ